jgi:hypothetical protein
LSLPLSGTAKSDTEFPYHINRTVEKKNIYNYTFEVIWETALQAVKEMEDIHLRKFGEKGLNSVKSSIKSDKSSGLITLNFTHKGEKGFFSNKKSLFYYQVLLIEYLEEQRTQVYFHEINFLSYDSYVFHVDQLARYVDFKPPAKNILEAIHARLRERGIESQ